MQEAIQSPGVLAGLGWISYHLKPKESWLIKDLDLPSRCLSAHPASSCPPIMPIHSHVCSDPRSSFKCGPAMPRRLQHPQGPSLTAVRLGSSGRCAVMEEGYVLSHAPWTQINTHGHQERAPPPPHSCFLAAARIWDSTSGSSPQGFACSWTGKVTLYV